MAPKPKKEALIYVDPEGVKITSPGLQDDPERDTILRGSVAPESFPLLKIDKFYQRELLSTEKNRDIQRAIDMGGDLPDVVLGMRGDRFTFDTAGAVVLLDPVFIIDGQQRIGTIRRHLEQFPSDPVRIGAQIHFSTTPQWERRRFTALNLFRTNMSANVTLANMRHDSKILATLYGLSNSQASFVLNKRVCWQQGRTGIHLISASTYMHIALTLHGSFAATRATSARMILTSLDNLERAVNLQIVRDNVARFWDVVDEAWGITEATSKAIPVHLKTGFLGVLARIIGDHVDFWDGHNLVVSPDLRKRLRAFKPNDPSYSHLVTGHGVALVLLRRMMIDHLNHRLRKKLTEHHPQTDTAEAA